jgi:hypothetical protein
VNLGKRGEKAKGAEEAESLRGEKEMRARSGEEVERREWREAQGEGRKRCDRERAKRLHAISESAPEQRRGEERRGVEKRREERSVPHFLLIFFAVIAAIFSFLSLYFIYLFSNEIYLLFLFLKITKKIR